MSQTLKFNNFSSSNLVAQTQINAAIFAGFSSLPVVNTQNFTNSPYVLVGNLNSNTSEIILAGAAITANSIPLIAATQQPHSQFDPVYALFGNAIKVYRAPDAGQGQQPPDSAFTVMPSMPILIDPTTDGTSYTDTNGGANYWYKYTYFNVSNLNETDLASSVAVRGTFTVSYCSLDEIRREAGFANSPYISDDQIDEKRQAAQDEINGALDEFYQTPLQPPINDFLKEICIRLAAGLLRQAQYSSISDPQVNGQNMYDAAQLDLDKLIVKERVLVNKQGSSLDSPGGSGSVDGWPNSSTAAAGASSGGAPRVFRMSDVQGNSTSTDAAGNAAGNTYYGRKW